MSLLGASRTGIHVVGELRLGLPGIRLPDIHASDIATLLPTALACFLLAYGETISVARSFAQKHGYEIDPQQELTALGAANIATGLAHGFPVAGGMSQTAVNDMGGASSPLAAGRHLGGHRADAAVLRRSCSTIFRSRYSPPWC